MSTPLVTAVIPTYNDAERVWKAVESALSQTWPEMEVIVVDDGSTDETQQVLAQRFGEGIRRIVQENGGVAAARNHGIREARGEYVATLDSDDTWAPEKIAKQMAAMEQLGAVLGTCDGYQVLDGQRLEETCVQATRHTPRSGWITDLLLECSIYKPSTYLFPRDLALEIGGFDEKLLACEDWDFMLRMSYLGPVAHSSEPLFDYLILPNSMSRNHLNMTIGLEQALRKQFENGLVPKEYASLHHLAWGKLRLQTAYYAYAGGEYSLFRRHLREAATHLPGDAVHPRHAFTYLKSFAKQLQAKARR